MLTNICIYLPEHKVWDWYGTWKFGD